MIEEHQRLELHAVLRRQLGDQPAATLMNQLYGIDTDTVATTSDIAELRAELRADISELRGRTDLAIARAVRVHVSVTLGAVLATGGLAFAAAGLG